MNTIKTTMLMALLMGVLIAVGGAFGGSHGASIMFIISLGFNFFMYWFSDTLVLKAYGARPVSQEEAPELYNLVANLAANAGLPMPTVCIVESNSPNAFATGRNPSHAAVAVTTGLMQALNYDEIGGVLSHELAHIKHHDSLISTMAAAIAGLISMIANMAQWMAIFGSNSDDDEGSNPLALILTIVIAPLAAALIQFAISRSREYEADKAGGEICGNPNALANALAKIEQYALVAPPMTQASNATAHMCIINPLKNSKERFVTLFSTHPATQDRIARLHQQALNMGK